MKLKIRSLSFIRNFLFEKEVMKHNQLITNSLSQFHGLMHITKMEHEADEREKGSWYGGIRGDAKQGGWVLGGHSY